MRQARASEKRWKKGGKRLCDIDGVPITIKDMVLTKGMPTRMGSLATDPDGPFNVDAPVAQRLREAGTVLLGKTTSPEYGWKGVTDSKLFGATHNPWKIGRTSGRLLGRRHRGRGGRHGQPRHRHRRRRLGPHPLLLLRPVWPQAHAGARAAVARVGAGHALAYRPDDPHRAATRR